jgi:hypothetical protein
VRPTYLLITLSAYVDFSYITSYVDTYTEIDTVTETGSTATAIETDTIVITETVPASPGVTPAPNPAARRADRRQVSFSVSDSVPPNASGLPPDCYDVDEYLFACSCLGADIDIVTLPAVTTSYTLTVTEYEEYDVTSVETDVPTVTDTVFTTVTTVVDAK